MDPNSTAIYKYDILHVNIRGIRANRDFLLDYLKDIGYPEIVLLNETKLSTSSHVKVDGYECISKRQQHKSYGSMIFVRSDISNVVEITELNSKFKKDEIIGAEILPSADVPGIKVFTLYNPPNTKPNPEIFRYLANQDGKIVLAGDLNCKNRSWGSTKTDQLGEELQENINENDLYILNDSSKTRCDPLTGKEETLDLFICNFDTLSIYGGFWVGPSVGSDHYPIHSRLQFRPKPENPRPEKERRLNNTDWLKFQNSLKKSHFPIPKTAAEADIVANTITSQIIEAFHASCPLTEKRKKKNKSPFTPEIKALVKNKRKLRREKNAALAAGDHISVRSIMTQINRLGSDIKKLQKNEKRQRLKKHCEQLSKEVNTKNFFRSFKVVANPILHSDSTPSNFQIITDEYGNTATTNEQKANLFANRLEKVHQEPNFDGFNDQWKHTVDDFINEHPDIYQTEADSEYLGAEEGDDSSLLQPVTLEEIELNLKKCKSKSAVGLDGISYELIKKFPNSYMLQFASFLTACMRLGHFPSNWKKAKVILIPKPGKDPRQAKNHRPISLLSCLGKILERILAYRLSNYLEQNKLFAKSQSGFRSKRMTTEQLLRLSEECHIGIKQKKVTSALFLDAEAAFDKCWHNGIRFKL